MEASIFIPYSVGIASENKALRTKELSIVPIEALPFVDGELVSSPVQMEFKGKDGNNQDYQGTMFTDNVIVASWLPMGNNRFTAPDIRRGERVMIYRLKDVDKFYWTSLGLDDHLRKLETVIFAFSANPKEGNETLDPSTCYYLEVSTHSKQVTFQTSKENGEPFGYTMQFDTNKGNVTLNDDIGNLFYMDSAEKYIKISNSLNNMIEIDKKNMRVTVPEKLHVKAGVEIKLECGGSVFTMTPAGTTLKTPTFKGSQ